MSQLSVRIQTYLVLGVMITCFTILYPKIFHPILMNMLGLSKGKTKDQSNADNFVPEHFRRPRPGRNQETVVQKDQVKKGGIMTIVLPVYAVGIVLYLLYTLTKIFNSRRQKNKDKKDEFLRHYYRDFHYDVDRGKFRMSHDSSDDERNEVSYNFDSHPTGRNKGHVSFAWDQSYKSDNFSDIYRSTKSLPKDLEQLLLKMENENLDADELSRLRMRLEQTEKEMTSILNAMQSAEKALRSSNNSQSVCDTPMNDVSDDESYTGAYVANNNDIQPDEDNAITASEGEIDYDESMDNCGVVRQRVLSS